MKERKISKEYLPTNQKKYISNYLDIYVSINERDSLIELIDYRIDAIQFTEYLKSNVDLVGVVNKFNYLKKVIMRIIENHEFEKQEERYSPIGMFKEMRSLYFELNQEDELRVSDIESFLIKGDYISCDELQELNHTIVDYMVSNKLELNLITFINLLKQSKKLRNKVDWIVLEKVIDDSIKDWRETIEKFNSKKEMAN